MKEIQCLNLKTTQAIMALQYVNPIKRMMGLKTPKFKHLKENNQGKYLILVSRVAVVKANTVKTVKLV